jgi:potassium efflux system protein
LIIAIDKNLKQNNIVIPFSQHDIHLINKDLDPKLIPKNEPDQL